ncbi:uncharacterized protein LOC113391056 [Ctenocephalides felis]|uniref:uncharacterized protein LOC113391056 n=1 Tax=Ctenocephalides felis TaxID=7515 RepID=UPI000E6E507C|nr:uncharacterized protein LOC113391056 [Ctenocephalides felis]
MSEETIMSMNDRAVKIELPEYSPEDIKLEMKDEFDNPDVIVKSESCSKDDDTCLERFMISEVTIEEEIKQEVVELPIYECDICNRSFAESDHLKKHMVDHIPSNSKECPFKCEICYKAFNRLSVLKVHMLIHSDKSSSVQHPDLSHHISDKIRNNLKTLIKNFPKGVSLTSIDSHYENNFGEKLSYNELGFPNALEFFLQLSDIFWLERISEFGEFILFDQSLKIPEDLIKNLKVQEKGVEKDIEDVSAVCKDETFKKIMEICNSEETLSGMMGPGDVIESIWNKCKFSCGCLMRIIITEIYDPTKFWFVLDDEDHFQLMNKMMDEMQ